MIFNWQENSETEESFPEDYDDMPRTAAPAFDIVSTRCAAHTLELVAGDVTNAASRKKTLAKARSVVHKLRTKALRSLPINRYGKKPTLDNKTRYGSKFDMVSRLIEMKEGVKEWGTSNRSLKITDQQWEALESFQKCLSQRSAPRPPTERAAGYEGGDGEHFYPSKG